MTTIANIPADGEPPIYAGTDHTIWGVVLESGAPKDIEGASIAWVIVAEHGAEPLVTKLSTDTDQIEISTGGLFIVHILGTDTESLGGLTLFHEARVEIDGAQEVVFAGTITITESDTLGLV